MKTFYMICAVSLNGVIGDSETNTIPWYLPQDLKHFKAVTSGKTVVMGSRTFDSIGKVLPNRRNVVISRNLNGEASYLEQAGVDECYKSIQDAIRTEREGFFIIGGQHIYSEAMHSCPAKLYMTIVDQEFKGDVRFPISGKQLKENFIITQQGSKYICTSRSEWFEDGGIRYQFVEFDYAP